MQRLEGWEDRMLAVVAAHQARPYEAGRSDCFVMAMECVEAVTGERPFADVSYSTDLGAARALRRRGFADLGEAMASLFPAVPRAFAHRGDIALIPVEAGFGVALGVVCAGGIAWRSSELVVLPMTAASGFVAVG